MDPHILLIGPALRHRSFSGANKALPVLASALQNAGFKRVQQLDLERRGISNRSFFHSIRQADLISIAGGMSPQWEDIDAMTRLIRGHLDEAGKKTPLIVGGYAAKGVDERFARLMPQITAFFDGEGEEGIVQLANAVARQNYAFERPSIPGLCYLDEQDGWHRSIAPRAKDFDKIDQNFGLVHLPQKHDMDIFLSPEGRPLKTAQLFTQRGCPWVCGYCNKSTEGANVAWLGMPSLQAQLSSLRDNGYQAVYLDVDTFTVNKSRSRSESAALHQAGLLWGSNTRIDMIDRELMRQFVSDGCAYMFFGVEHIVPEVTLAIGKFNGHLSEQILQARAYPQKVKAVFSDMRSVGLPSSYFIILGLPAAILGEEGQRIDGYRHTTFEEDLQAIAFGLEQCQPDYLNLNVMRFMPGSVAADTPSHPAFSIIRPTGEQPVQAAHFIPRLASYIGYRTPGNHPVFRLCESVGTHQPRTMALDEERLYHTVEATMSLINARIEKGHPATKLFIEPLILEQGLVRHDVQGRYALAPMREFDRLDEGAPSFG